MNCEDLPGRLRDICDGTARKKNGDSFTESERQAIVNRRTSTNLMESDFPVAESTGYKKRGCVCGKKK